MGAVCHSAVLSVPDRIEITELHLHLFILDSQDLIHLLGVDGSEPLALREELVGAAFGFGLVVLAVLETQAQAGERK